MTPDRVRELLEYDPPTGVFRWKIAPSRRVAVGQVAGSRTSDGYLRIGVDNRDYLLHRLAWLWMTGQWPNGEVDHRNGVRCDNRWHNLRDVTPVVNQQNRRACHSGNRCGLLGASWDEARQKFVAQISINKTRRWLGYHESAESAHQAYLAAKRAHHEGNTL